MTVGHSLVQQTVWRTCSRMLLPVDEMSSSTTKTLTEDYKLWMKITKFPECGKPSIFMGERQSSALGLLKKSSRSRVINESLCKLRGLVTENFMLVLQGHIHGLDSNVIMPGGQVPETDRYVSRYVVGDSFGLHPRVEDFTLPHIFQVDSAGVQVILRSPPGVQVLFFWLGAQPHWHA